MAVQTKENKPQKENTVNKSRVLRAGSYSVIASLVVIAIVFVINLLVAQLPSSITKVDLSTNKLLVISEQTKEVLGTVEDDITVYLIAPIGAEDPVIVEFIKRYTDLNNKIHYQQIDPVINPNFAANYTSLEPTDNSIVVECGDRYVFLQPRDIYQYDYTLANMTGNMADVFGEFKGEAAITGAITYVTSENLPKIYSLSGHGEMNLPDSFSTAMRKENFDVVSLDLLSTNEISADCSSLLIYAPLSDITPAEKDIILSYLQQGGKMMLVTNFDSSALVNLKEIMAYYGASTYAGLTIDNESCLYQTPTFLFPQIGNHVLTAPLLNGRYRLLVPFAEGITVADNLREGVIISGLLSTTESSFVKVEDLDSLEAGVQVEKTEADIDGPVAVAIAISEVLDDANDVETNIVWVTTSAMFDESVNEMVSGVNLDFFLNCFGWLAEVESSITIHAKELRYETLQFTDSQVTWGRIILVGIIPAICVALAVFVWLRRKRR